MAQDHRRAGLGVNRRDAGAAMPVPAFSSWRGRRGKSAAPACGKPIATAFCAWREAAPSSRHCVTRAGAGESISGFSCGASAFRSCTASALVNCNFGLLARHIGGDGAVEAVAQKKTKVAVRSTTRERSAAARRRNCRSGCRRCRSCHRPRSGAAVGVDIGAVAAASRCRRRPRPSARGGPSPPLPAPSRARGASGR